MLFAAHASADDADPDALGVLTFTPGAQRLSPEQRNQVERIAVWQANHPDSLLVIEGYAPRRGSPSKNLRLTQDRTDSVRDALIMAGADRTRMVLVAHPDAEPGVRSPRVRIRGIGEFTDLAREQRDPEIGEDARAARRTVPRREVAAPRGRAPATAGETDGAMTEDTAKAAGTTVVIVPSGAPARAPTGNTTEPVPAGGPERTSGGNGLSAQTGLGYDPTDEVPPGLAGGTGRL
jgi:hypothetical protein